MEENLDAETNQNYSSQYPRNSAEKQLPAGSVLANRYLIKDVIGIGGMGSVYKARDLHFKKVIKVVAVKEMVNQAVDPIVKESIVQNFEREANILVQLSHSSIPEIYDYFSHQNRSYLVIEYIYGKDLEKILNETKQFIPVKYILSWAIELCDVLAYLHNYKPKPIIFRDIKPSNIMINKDNHVVLIDFGIAKTFTIGAKGTIIGTEGYSPPEQYKGIATETSDIYALGATLHHVLTRRDPRLDPPFSFPERKISDLNPEVPEDFVKIIEKALSYDPENRYQSAQEMKEEMLKVSFNKSQTSVVSTETEERLELNWKFEADDEIRGSAFVSEKYACFGSHDRHLYFIDTNSGESVWKFETRGRISSKPVVFDQTLFFGSEDNNLYALSVQGKRMIWKHQTDGPIRCSPFISDQHIFTGSDDGKLYAINVYSSKLAWKLEIGSKIRSSPVVDNERIIFGNDSGELVCVSFRGEIRWRYKTRKPIYATPLVADNMVFVPSLDGYFYAIDIKTGWVVWKFRMNMGSVSSPVIADFMVVFGSADGNIYALDRKNGNLIWRFETGNQVSGSPVVDGANVYCGNADGTLFVINSKNGKLKSSFKTNGPITCQPTIFNNKVYFGSMDHLFYVLENM